MKVFWKLQRLDKPYYNSDFNWIDHEILTDESELKSHLEYWKHYKPSYDWRIVEVKETLINFD